MTGYSKEIANIAKIYIEEQKKTKKKKQPNKKIELTQ